MGKIPELYAIFRQVHPMTPMGPWTLQGQIYIIYGWLVYPGPKLHSGLHHSEPYSRCMVVKSRKCTQDLTLSWIFNSGMHLVCTKHLPQRPKFWSVSPFNLSFSRHKVVEIGKIGNDPEQLTGKRTICALSTYPPPPTPHPSLKVQSYALRPAVFEMQGCWKSEKWKWTKSDETDLEL